MSEHSTPPIAPVVVSPAANVRVCQVPTDRGERDRVRAAVGIYAAGHLTPPLPLADLRTHAAHALQRADLPLRHVDLATILLSNVLWRDTVASVPFHRRILLLPQCLRARASCPAEMDEFGLACVACGNCPTGELQAEAERLGYVVLVAEGTTIVTKMLEQGRVDAVIGVGCPAVLEKSFPYMSAEAIPGIAIPLYRDGCDATAVDLDWVTEAIRLQSSVPWHGRVDIHHLRSEVESWFSLGSLRAILASQGTLTEELATEWLSRTGKRWRPLLTAAAYQALRGATAPLPVSVRTLAVAVECFHKASLIHDDIEDNDDFRYGQETLHKRYGIPIALNAGDYLLGEGYRLITACGVQSEAAGRMLAVAATGHRDLCLGQGDELTWRQSGLPLSANAALDIFRRKTAPAFDVALRLGAICAGAGDDVCAVLRTFSENLGIAYQIRDDLEDFDGGAAPADPAARRPSLILALACENLDTAGRQRLTDAWLRPAATGPLAPDPGRNGDWAPALNQARDLLEAYRSAAVSSLEPLSQVELKSLLHRLTGRILGPVKP